LLQLILTDSFIPLLWAILLLDMAYSLLLSSGHFGCSFAFSTQLQIAPLYAALALLKVLQLAAFIVVRCLRQLLKQSELQTLHGATAH